jgi:hypothetical protein
MKTILLGSLLMLAVATAHAGDTPPEEAARREQLKQERSAIQQGYAQRQAACRETFAVTDCLNRARTDMHAKMKVVRAQELELDDAARKRRAQANAERLNAKAETARARQESASAPQAAEAPASGASRAAPKKRGFEADGMPKPTTPRTSEDEAQSRERFEARQREMREHREEVLKRNAEKAKSAPPAQRLPVPTAASAATGGR